MKWLATILLFLTLRCSAVDSIVSFVDWSDIHCEILSHGTRIATGDAAIDWILTHTNDGVWNIKGFLSPGDLYEQETNDISGAGTTWRLSNLTNQFQRMVTNGLLVIPSPGNHEADSWNDYLDDIGTYSRQTDTFLAYSNVFPFRFFTQQVGFVEFRTGTDPRDVAMTYTNGSLKLLFVTFGCSITNVVGGISNNIVAQVIPQVAWASNKALAFPDHQVVLLMHSVLSFTRPRGVPFIDWNGYSEGSFTYPRIPHGQSIFQAGAQKITNLLSVIVGHNRAMSSGHVVLNGIDPKHTIDVAGFNMQLGLNVAGVNNGRYLKILTFNIPRRILIMRVYDVTGGVEVENFDSAWHETGPTYDFYHKVKWTVPFIGSRRLLTQ